MFRPCPICGNTERTQLFQQHFASIEGVTFLTGYDVVQCKNCGFLFADQIPGQEQFDEYYRYNSKYEGDYTGHVPSSVVIEHYRHSLGFLESVLRGAGRDSKQLKIVDIGCATGNFLNFMRENGYTALSGIDPSAECVQIMEQCGIHSVQSSLFQLDETASASYDVVMLLTVLEHIRDLSRTISVVKQVLRPNGFLYLSVPDAFHFYQEDWLAFQQFSSEHINYFTMGSLRNLLSQHSFDLLGYRVHKDISTGTNAELDAVFQLAPSLPVQTQLICDHTADWSIAKYIAQCTELEAAWNRRLEGLVRSQEPLLVWGCGTHTLRQLAVGSLGKCNIRAFIDSNPHFQGHSYSGIPILSPKELDPGGKERILISVFSPLTAQSIMRYAKDVLHIDGRLFYFQP